MRTITLLLILFLDLSSLYSAMRDHYPQAIYLLMWSVILSQTIKEEDKQ